MKTKSKSIVLSINYYKGFQKCWNRITLWSSHPLLIYTQKWKEFGYIPTILRCLWIPISTERQKQLKSPSIDRYKQNVLCAYTGILLNPTKEINSVTCCNTDEPWGHHAQWGKSNTKTTDGSNYMRSLEQGDSQKKSRMGLARGWREERRECCCLRVQSSDLQNGKSSGDWSQNSVNVLISLQNCTRKPG